MRDKLGIAIVGCGAISYANAEAIRKSSNARLSYAMDLNLASAKAFGEKYSIPFTDRLEKVLSAPEVDAVFICTPHYLHAPIAEQAAEAGKHVIVEKPMGTNLADSRRIVEACRKSGVKLSVCYCMRYSRKIQFAREFINAGGLGNIIGMQITMLRDQSERYLGHDIWQEGSINWHGVKAKSGGGLFIDNIAHYLDYYLYITGLKIDSIYCRAGAYLLPTEVEDNLFALFNCDNNAIGTVTAGFGVRGSGQEQNNRIGNALQRIWGEDGHMLLIPRFEFFSMRRIDNFEPNRWHAPKPSRIYNSLGTGIAERTEFVERFALAVIEDRDPDISGEFGVRVMSVIDAAYRSSLSGSEEKVEFPQP